MEAALIGIGVTAISAVAAFATARFTQRKLNAEGTQILVQTALDLNEPLKARIAVLEARVDELEQGVEILLLQMAEEDIQPIWRPR